MFKKNQKFSWKMFKVGNTALIHDGASRFRNWQHCGWSSSVTRWLHVDSNFQTGFIWIDGICSLNGLPVIIHLFCHTFGNIWWRYLFELWPNLFSRLFLGISRSKCFFTNSITTSMFWYKTSLTFYWYFWPLVSSSEWFWKMN